MTSGYVSLEHAKVDSGGCLYHGLNLNHICVRAGLADSYFAIITSDQSDPAGRYDALVMDRDEAIRLRDMLQAFINDTTEKVA